MNKLLLALILVITGVFSIEAFENICSDKSIKALENCYKTQLFRKYNLPKNAQKFVGKLKNLWDTNNQTLCHALDEFDICLGNEIITNCINEADFTELSFAPETKTARIYVQAYYEFKSNCQKLFETQLEEAAQISSTQTYKVQPNMIVFSFFVAIFSLILL